MRKLFSIIAVLQPLFFSNLYSQETLTYERLLSPFNWLELAQKEDIVIANGEQYKLIVKYKSGNPESIVTELKNDKLIINLKQKENNLVITSVRIEAPTFVGLTVLDAANVESDGVIKTDSIEIVVSGTGDLELLLEANKVKTTISGAGDVDLAGKAIEHQTVISGAGNLNAINLQTKKTIANISGSGDAKVHATDELTAVITGAGGVFYKHEPLKKNIDVSRAGTARKIDGTSPAKDSTKIRLGDTRIIIVPDNGTNKEFDFRDTSLSKPTIYYHWAGIDMGINLLYFNDNKNVQPSSSWMFLEPNYRKSFNWRINFAERAINLYQRKINLISGLGFEWANYGLLKNYTLRPNAPKISADTALQKFKKNRLQSIWFNVPLLLEFNTGNSCKKSFHFSVGVMGGYRLSTNYKQVFNRDDKPYKYKVKDDFNLNDYKFAAMVRAGYGKYSIWAECNLFSMYKNKQGPLVYPLIVGISLIPFN